MRLASEFIRLPLSFDVDRLVQEAHQFSEYDWDYHPLGYQGNTALSLISSGGDASNSTSGAMAPTKAFERTPYIRQIMLGLNTVVGRSRFMRLAPKSVVPPHSDTDYAWRKRVRIHIPIITDPAITFSSLGDERIDVHMRAGEAWIFDNWREHTVNNPTDVRRIHLVIDTVGTADFWKLASTGWDPRSDIAEWEKCVQPVVFKANSENTDVAFEAYNSAPVRSPDEVENMIQDFLYEIAHMQDKAPEAWSLYWCLPDNIGQYKTLTEKVKVRLKPKLANVALKSNRVDAYSVIANWLDHMTDANAELSKPNSTKGLTPATQKAPVYHKPIFIVSAPRSGSTILFEALKTNKLLWSLGDENDRVLESIENLHPKTKGYVSNELSAQMATPSVKNELRSAFAANLKNASGVAYHDVLESQRASSLRLVDKTLKNALRIPFLKAVFPDAKFVLISRDAKGSIASLAEAWRSERFISYSELEIQANWSMPLIENWRDLIGKSPLQIAAQQWASITKIMSRLLNNPANSLRLVCEFCELPFGPKMKQFGETGFALSKLTLDAPSENKWRAYEAEISEQKLIYKDAEDELNKLISSL